MKGNRNIVHRQIHKKQRNDHIPYSYQFHGKIYMRSGFPRAGVHSPTPPSLEHAQGRPNPLINLRRIFFLTSSIVFAKE